MKKRFLILLLLTYSICFSQSTGVMQGTLCYCDREDSNTCNKTNVNTIITIPYDGKLVFTGTLTAASTPTEEVQHSFYASITYENYEGDQNSIGIISFGGVNSIGDFHAESGGILAGSKVRVDLSMNPKSQICQSLSYGLRYELVPMNFANDTEPNDNYLQATDIFENVSYEGHGSFTPDDMTKVLEGEDWYKLIVPRNGKLKVKVSADAINDNYNTYLNIYSISKVDVGNPRLLGHNSSNGSDNFLAVANCVKKNDVIYLNFGGSDNSYRFNWIIEGVPNGFIDAEPNDSSNNAILINNGELKRGNLGYGVSLDNNSQSLEDASDWYKFTTNSGGNIKININSEEPLVDLAAHFYSADKNGNLINAIINGNQNDGYVANCMAAGTYFINLKALSNPNNSLNNNGACEKCCTTYTLDVNFENTSTYDSDSNDNNEIDMAEQISPNTDMNGQIGYIYHNNEYDTADYYELVTDYNGDLSISFTEPLPPNSVLLYYKTSSGLQQVGTVSKNSKNEITGLGYSCAASGESYFLFFQYLGSCYSYQFNYTNTLLGENTEIEPNNDFNNAQELGKSDNISGHLSFGNPSNTDTYDFYSIPVTESSPIKIDFDLYNNGVVELLESENTSPVVFLNQSQNTAPITSLRYNNVDASKKYHLRMSSNSCMNYDLYGWSQGFTSKNDIEPNNSPDNAIKLQLNKDYEGRLYFSNNSNDTQDFYKFKLLNNEEVQIIFDTYEGLINNAKFSLFDMQGNQVFEFTNKNKLKTTEEFIRLNTGNYYFIVSGTDQTGSYKISINPQSSLSVSNNEYLNDSVSVFPNPTDKSFTVSSSRGFPIEKISIYNLLGKLIKIENEEFTSIDISNLVKGIYFLKIKTTKGFLNKKLIVN